MGSSLLFFGLLVVFSYCEGNNVGRLSDGVAGSGSYSRSNAYNAVGSSSGYPVDTGPGVIAGSESQSSSSGFSGNNGAGGSFSGSQSQSGAGSFVNNNVGQLGSESGSSVGDHRNLENQGQSFGQTLGNAIIETASQVQSAVNSGIAQLGSNIHNNVQSIANAVASGISSNLETLNTAQAASAATAANIQNNVQNIANAVASGISSNLETLNAAQAASEATAANIQNNVQNIANSVASDISNNLETLNAAQAASAATAANIQNNVQNIANSVANGISSNLETLNALQGSLQAASAATAANIQNNVQNIANTVAGGISSNLDALNAVQGSSQTAVSSSAESGIGQTAINQVANDRVGQHPYDTVGPHIGNIDQTNIVSGNSEGVSSISSGGVSGTFHTNTVTSVSQNGQTVIKHEEIIDRLGERPQSTSGTVVLDNNGQVIASEVHPGGLGNYAPRPETHPTVYPGYAQGSLQSSSVSTSTQNGQTVITHERVPDSFGEQPHSSSETLVLDGNGHVIASNRPTNFAANGVDSVSSANSGFAQGSSGFSADQTRPVVNGEEVFHAQVSNSAGINEQASLVPASQSSGNSFFDNLASSFGSGGAVGTFHSTSVSSSTNQNGQTVVSHQETSDRLGVPQHSSSETVVVNNGVVSGVTCVDNQCVTHGN